MKPHNVSYFLNKWHLWVQSALCAIRLYLQSGYDHGETNSEVKCGIGNWEQMANFGVAVAQVVERSLPMSTINRSNPVGGLCYSSKHYVLSTVFNSQNKRKRDQKFAIQKYQTTIDRLSFCSMARYFGTKRTKLAILTVYESNRMLCRGLALFVTVRWPKMTVLTLLFRDP